MRRVSGSVALASLLLVAYSARAMPNGGKLLPETVPGESRLIELYEQYSAAVVKVKVATQTTDEEGNEKVELTVQSGFYIDELGTVLTNAVPMQQGPRIRIEKNNLQLLAVPIASDSRSNLALIRVAKPPSGLTYIDLSLPPTTPPIGSLAYSITSPLDFAATPKQGIVTGHESGFSEIVFPFTYTRISIPSGPAEGGSPVFNSSGKLIGISVASLPDVNSSYIVPTRALQTIISRLEEKTGGVHPIVRAVVLERTDPDSLEQRLIVDKIDPKSAAARSGLKTGDQIISLNNQKLKDLNSWRDAIFFNESDSFVSLLVQRNDQEKEITLLLESE